MKYLSLFSGIGGFELGIQQAYEKNNRVCDCIRFKTTRRQDFTGEQDDLLQSCRCQTRKENRKDITNNDTISSKINELSQMGIEPENSTDNTSSTPQYAERPLCVGYSEIDKYAIKTYQKHFPEHKNYGDITKINAEELPDFDLLVGGFPCQSFSIAGLRRGFEDTRGTMFFEIARIIREKQPRLLFLENVKGLLSHDDGKTFYTIISSLDELGYDVQWQVINSKNHGVPQNRERVFIVGHLRKFPRPEVFPFTDCSPQTPKQLVGGSQGNRVYSDEGTSITIASEAGGQGAKTGLYVAPNIRRLTPKECERLQGFPDGWTEGLSDTQRYKTLGNAVTVDVIRDIMEKLI